MHARLGQPSRPAARPALRPGRLPALRRAHTPPAAAPDAAADAPRASALRALLPRRLSQAASEPDAGVGGPTSSDAAAVAAGQAPPSTWLFEPEYGLPIVRRVSL